VLRNRLKPFAEAALGVDVEDCHRVAPPQQGDREVRGDGGLSGAALLLCDRDDPAGHANQLRQSIVASQHDQRN
jgi:hypothetical protein